MPSRKITDLSNCEDIYAKPVKVRTSNTRTKEEEWLQRPVPHPSARVSPFTKREGETRIKRTEQEIDDWLMEPYFTSPMEERRHLKRHYEDIVLQCEEESRNIEKKIALIQAKYAENEKKIANSKQEIGRASCR